MCGGRRASLISKSNTAASGGAPGLRFEWLVIILMAYALTGCISDSVSEGDIYGVYLYDATRHVDLLVIDTTRRYTRMWWDEDGGVRVHSGNWMADQSGERFRIGLHDFEGLFDPERVYPAVNAYLPVEKPLFGTVRIAVSPDEGLYYKKAPYALGAARRLFDSLVAEFVGCERTAVVKIEMEPYYLVFDKMLDEVHSEGTEENKPVRRAFIRVRDSLADRMTVGDSVLTCFQKAGDHLVAEKLLRVAAANECDPTQTLAGKVIGRDVANSSVLVGFSFRVTEAEAAATIYSKGTQKIVLVYFTVKAGRLKYDRLEVTREASGDPILWK